MRVFITGASGHLASALIPELIGAGHEVVGLARSDTSAAAVAALGADVHRGSLDDLDGLREAVTSSDGVIHLAFKHEEMRTGDLDGPLGADLAAIEAMGEALAGTGKPFVGTSGTIPLTFGGVEPLARRPHARRGPPVPLSPRRRPGRVAPPRRRRRRHSPQGDRRSDRPQPGPADRQHRTRGDRRLLRFPGLLHLARQPGLEHLHPRAVGLAPDASRADRRSQ
jgi:hypothetical protein